jgi:hypothetical protein
MPADPSRPDAAPSARACLGEPPERYTCHIPVDAATMAEGAALVAPWYPQYADIGAGWCAINPWIAVPLRLAPHGPLVGFFELVPLHGAMVRHLLSGAATEDDIAEPHLCVPPFDDPDMALFLGTVCLPSRWQTPAGPAARGIGRWRRRVQEWSFLRVTQQLYLASPGRSAIAIHTLVLPRAMAYARATGMMAVEGAPRRGDGTVLMTRHVTRGGLDAWFAARPELGAAIDFRCAAAAAQGNGGAGSARPDEPR